MPRKWFSLGQETSEFCLHDKAYLVPFNEKLYGLLDLMENAEGIIVHQALFHTNLPVTEVKQLSSSKTATIIIIIIIIIIINFLPEVSRIPQVA